MTKSIYKEILDKLPPSTQNNMRSYVIRKLGINMKYPSDARRQELEDILDDLSIDHSDSDFADMDLVTNKE